MNAAVQNTKIQFHYVCMDFLYFFFNFFKRFSFFSFHQVSMKFVQNFQLCILRLFAMCSCFVGVALESGCLCSLLFTLLLLEFSFLFCGGVLVLLVFGHQIVHVGFGFCEFHLVHTWKICHRTLSIS